MTRIGSTTLVVLLSLLTNCAGIRDAHFPGDCGGPHDLVEDILSGLNGPLVRVVARLDQDRRQGEIVSIEPQVPNEAIREAVRRHIEGMDAAAREVNLYGLSFLGADGSERKSEVIEAHKAKDGYVFDVTTNRPFKAVRVTFEWTDDTGQQRVVTKQLPPL